ncbi:putative CHY-type Zn-finger protein [Alkalihalobacillus xiaoxiensis]|uniref:CHY-type Zn-finger protein n=1 Tax=Shouchella xiaoxiensis TaxID=766895 RepID=A0ABS2SXH6_9BACI|nr:CHY zinc finger protein [Shouchella xiaoxiensis]MBM7839726.1 putative CHY-type Zn-finger protein [Shouchella xiaoxiensis]
MINVFGAKVDEQTRCIHYHSERDVVAIKFACCQTFYPCYKCHQDHCSKPLTRWQKDQFEQKAILCGSCQELLSINEYMQVSSCPACDHPFNPNCSAHFSYYFQI